MENEGREGHRQEKGEKYRREEIREKRRVRNGSHEKREWREDQEGRVGIEKRSEKISGGRSDKDRGSQSRGLS